jgi:hypothetical protein
MTTTQIICDRVIVSVAESKNLRCHPCESRGPERKSWIPASAGMTNTVSATVTIYYKANSYYQYIMLNIGLTALWRYREFFTFTPFLPILTKVFPLNPPILNIAHW